MHPYITHARMDRVPHVLVPDSMASVQERAAWPHAPLMVKSGALDAQLGARDGAAGELAREGAELETRLRRDRAELAAGDGLADGEAPPG